MKYTLEICTDSVASAVAAQKAERSGLSFVPVW